MIVEIAVATRTAPADWYNEDDATIATVIDVLTDHAERMNRRR